MRVRHRLSLVSLCGALALAWPVASAAEMGLAEREAAQAKAEEDAEAAMGEGAVPIYTGTGTLTLGAVNPDVSDVVGVLRTEKGGVLQLKLQDQALLRLLKACNGKTVTLTGHLRNAGKYLVVVGTISAEPPPVQRRKKSGF